MADKGGRWLRLDASWRSERAARRAGRAGRDVFLASAEMASEHGWGCAGERGWLPDDAWDVREVAAHLGEDDGDATVLAELELGLAACVREGLLVRDDARKGHWIARDWWERMLPDRTARHRKATSRGADDRAATAGGGAAAGHGNCRDIGAGASPGPRTAEPAQGSAEAVTATPGNCRDTATAGAETAPAAVACRSLPPVAADCRTLPPVTAIAAYETRRDETKKDPPTPAGAGAPTADASPQPQQPDAGPPLTPGDRAAVRIIAAALAAGELKCETPAQVLERCNANKAATYGSGTKLEEGRAWADRVRDAEAERRRQLVASLEAGDVAACRWAVEQFRDHECVRWKVREAYKRESSEERGRRRRGEPVAAPRSAAPPPPAVAQVAPPPPRPAAPAARPQRSELPEMGPADRWHVLAAVNAIAGEIGNRALPAIGLLKAPLASRGPAWWSQAAAVYCSSLSRPSAVDQAVREDDVQRIAKLSLDEEHVRAAVQLALVQPAYRWGLWYRLAREVGTAEERRVEALRAGTPAEATA